MGPEPQDGVGTLGTASADPSRRPSAGALFQQSMIVLVVVLTLAVWFSATAVVPALMREWRITAVDAVWLTASVQVGFVIGAVASSLANLSDRMRPHLLLALSAGAASTCTLLFAAIADGMGIGMVLRALTGIFMAGIYPVGMKLMVSWSRSIRRGTSLGVLLGALTLGSALPHLIGGLAFDWRVIMSVAAGLTLVGGLTCLVLVRLGPQLPHERQRANPTYLVSMFRDRQQRLINLGYFGHMWELYAMWVWLPAFLSNREESGSVSLAVFVSVGLAGVVGCLVGGWASDHRGRARTALWALVVSGTCCLASPAAFVAPAPILLAFMVIWGASVIADSGVFSTMLSERANPRFVGTALTAQTAIGFLVTVVTIQLLPLVAEIVGWQFSFLFLLPGPIAGAVAMYFLTKTNVSTEIWKDHQ